MAANSTQHPTEFSYEGMKGIFHMFKYAQGWKNKDSGEGGHQEAQDYTEGVKSFSGSHGKDEACIKCSQVFFFTKLLYAFFFIFIIYTLLYSGVPILTKIEFGSPS